MLKLLGFLAAALTLAAPASADELPREFTSPAIPQTVDWTGYYAGVNAGWIGANSTITSAFPGSNDIIKPSDSGALYGLHAGVNKQMGHFVMGFEVSVDHTDLYGEGNWTGSFFPSNQGSDFDTSWLGLGSIRMGYAEGQWLAYGVGGIAVGDIRSNYRCRPCAPELLNSATNSNTHVGWSAGAGIEYMIRPNISFGVEYVHIDLGKDFYADTDPVCSLCDRNVDLDADVVRARLSYMFGGRNDTPAPLK